MPNSNLTPRSCNPTEDIALNFDGTFDLDQLIPPEFRDVVPDWGELSGSPDSIIRSIEMELDRQSSLNPPSPSALTQSMDADDSIRYIQSLPPQSLAPFQHAGPAPQPANHPPAPQAFTTPRLPIMPGVTGREELPNIMPMPLPAMTQGAFMQPWVPFWTACPLPFNPVSYPQTVLPPTQEVPMCPPSSNPLARRIAEKKSLKESKDQSPSSPHTSASATGGKATKTTRTRAPKSPADPLMTAQLNELKNRLASSETESSLLRATLLGMEQELSRQKALLGSTPHGSPAMAAHHTTPVENMASPVTPPPTPAGVSPPRQRAGTDIYNTASLYKTRTSTSVDAFNQKIDFTHVELRKTNPEKIEAEKREYIDAQAQWHQRQNQQQALMHQQHTHLTPAPAPAFVPPSALQFVPRSQPQAIPHHHYRN